MQHWPLSAQNCTSWKPQSPSIHATMQAAYPQVKSRNSRPLCTAMALATSATLKNQKTWGWRDSQTCQRGKPPCRVKEANSYPIARDHLICLYSIYVKYCQILSDITWPHLPESRHRYPPWSRDALPARCSVRSTCNGSSLQCTRRNHDASWLNQENSMMFERIWIRKTATCLKGHVNHWMLVDSRQNIRENNRSVKIHIYKCHSYPPCISC